MANCSGNAYTKAAYQSVETVQVGSGLYTARRWVLTILLIDEGTEGLGVLGGQEGADPPSEDVPHHQGPLKGHPLVGPVPLQWGGCRQACTQVSAFFLDNYIFYNNCISCNYIVFKTPADSLTHQRLEVVLTEPKVQLGG